MPFFYLCVIRNKMKKQLLGVLVLLLAIPFTAAAQKNNPLDIDPASYTFYIKAEALVGKEGFETANRLLLDAAVRSGDRKAQTLHYVEALKDLCVRTASAENDVKVLEAQQKVKDVAREWDFPQYYYYSFQLVQRYYLDNGQQYRTMELMREMQETALREGNAYGMWIADRYLASMYIDQNDYVSAKPHLLQAISLYHDTQDQTIREQSPTRLYCDLADTYPIGSDSVHVNVRKAMDGAKEHMDTLRFRYYLARLAALDGKKDEYQRLRDLCMEDSQLQVMRQNAPLYFSLIDAVFDGSILEREEEIVNLSRIREMKVIANLCENQGYKDFAFALEKSLVGRLETAISSNNQSHLNELDVTMGKAALNADLRQKEEQMNRITHLILLSLIFILGGIVLFSFKHVRDLKKANEKVRLADAAKTRFVQNMSHEVRTPLNAIVGFSQLLALPDGTLDPQEKEEFSGHIVNNTKMLTMLLDDILNASAMDSGNYRISYEEGEKDFMAEAAISSAEHRLQSGVTMTYQPSEAEHFSFTTDPRRVQQILINLLTNACKHTSKGSIVLTSSLSERPGYLTYAVTDTGPGIPPEDAERIFERFTKLNDFVQGTGLGLSICRDIAGRMGADVFLDTAYSGGGARFVFQVPLEKPTETK